MQKPVIRFEIWGGEIFNGINVFEGFEAGSVGGCLVNYRRVLLFRGGSLSCGVGVGRQRYGLVHHCVILVSWRCSMQCSRSLQAFASSHQMRPSELSGFGGRLSYFPTTMKFSAAFFVNGN